jgi:pimeloyl-ACP methyl ester carboxylesterase
LLEVSIGHALVSKHIYGNGKYSSGLSEETGKMVNRLEAGCVKPRFDKYCLNFCFQNPILKTKRMEILNSKIFGENLSSTPLLVFHGLFGMLDNWGTFGKDFGEFLPTHLIDLRNHGRSFHSDEMSRRFSDMIFIWSITA